MQKEFERSISELEGIVAFTTRFFDEESLDPALRGTVDLLVEELFTNLVKFNTETREKILIQMKRHGDGIEVSLTDFDVDRFDPREIPVVDIEAPLAERTAGGLGLHLVLKMVDSIHYEYENRTSTITFWKSPVASDV